MLVLWLFVGLVHSCTCGGLYPAAPGQFLTTAEAHGPLARQALHSMAAAGTLQYYSDPGPLAASAPLAHVGYLHQVPAVADVPITKFSTQPAYFQRLVDVEQPKVATAKLQVRRPAIQKQFYDIEERTLIRPVGSAVVELDEPISKNLVSPLTVSPAGHHTVAQYYRPQAYPFGSFPFVPYSPFQVPFQSFNPAFVQFSPVVPQRPTLAPRPPQQLPALPQQPDLQPQPQPPQPQPPQSFPQPTEPSLADSFPNDEFDSSDTVVVNNPDFERFGGQADDQPNSESATEAPFDPSERQEQEQPDSAINTQNSEMADSPMSQQILDEFQSRQLMRQFLNSNFFQPNDGLQQDQIVQQEVQTQPPAPIQQTQRAEDTTTNEATEETTKEETSSETTTVEASTLQAETSNETTTTEGNSENNQTSFRFSLQPQNTPNLQVRAFPSEGQIASQDISPEKAQENQQKLIELLTGRGEVSEVGLSKSGVQLSGVGDTGVIRGRVLSVTPAPHSTGETQERVSTRRVVVSRPIQTLQEVEVHQPFTKLERVAVHEPALLKTAHTHITRIPLVYHH